MELTQENLENCVRQLIDAQQIQTGKRPTKIAVSRAMLEVLKQSIPANHEIEVDFK